MDVKFVQIHFHIAQFVIMTTHVIAVRVAIIYLIISNASNVILL
jgi:hypothetical protein